MGYRVIPETKGLYEISKAGDVRRVASRRSLSQNEGWVNLRVQGRRGTVHIPSVVCAVWHVGRAAGCPYCEGTACDRSGLPWAPTRRPRDAHSIAMAHERFKHKGTSK